MRKLIILTISVLFLIIFTTEVSAHCPLCTMGAGAAAAGAVWLGVQKAAVAVLIGGFAMSMGMWFSRLVKKKYIPYQKTLIIALVFLLTVTPLLPIIGQTQGFYLSLGGDYGSLTNRTYVFNMSLITSLLGGAIVFVAPSLSNKITKKRMGKIIPFQGIILTLVLLITAGIVTHFVI